MAKSAIEKRDTAKPPAVKVLQSSAGPAFPPGRMLIASPLAVQEIVARIPPKQVLTMGDLRGILADEWHADYTCPLTTGIFLRIVAEAALEEGGQEGIPWHRVVRDNGELLSKLPGGVDEQARRLLGENIPLTSRGQRRFVADLPRFRWKRTT